MTSREIISRDLKALGIKEGDVIIVHSSLSSMGRVDGGAETVIDALSDVTGVEGTLLFPAFTYKEVYESGCYDHKNTPVCVGAIPEAFRKRDGVIRSLHPTHSVAATGKYAFEITRDHKKSNTPMGDSSPYRKLYEYGAKILMLGCRLSSTSYIHALEEEAGVPYALTKEPVTYKIIDGDGNAYEKEYFTHNFKRNEAPVSQRYTKCIDILTEGEGYTVGEVHGAKSYLIDARSLHDAALKRMEREPYFFTGVKDMLTYKRDYGIKDDDGYDVIILAGQSNAVGYGAGDTDDVFTESDDMMEIKDTNTAIAYVTNEEGKRYLDMPFPPDLDYVRLGDRYAYERWNACLANTFAESYKRSGRLKCGRKLLVVKTAVGGTGFIKEQWTDGGVCDVKMYHMIKEAFKLSKNMRIVAFLWHQGEADAFDLPEMPRDERRERYVKNFGDFVRRVREKLGRNFPIICGEFTRAWMEKNSETTSAVLSAMREVIDRDGFGDIVSSEGLIPNGVAIGTTDILHFSRDGLNKFGRRYFEAYERLTRSGNEN